MLATAGIRDMGHLHFVVRGSEIRYAVAFKKIFSGLCKLFQTRHSMFQTGSDKKT
jgi:hypothetical protein